MTYRQTQGRHFFQRGNKYGAKTSEYNGERYDSKFEATVAAELDLRQKAGEIKDWERQFPVDLYYYDSEGNRHKFGQRRHKVDFRVHEIDGSFTLLEAKGIETADYRMRRAILEHVWLRDNADHTYEVVKDDRKRRR